MFKPEGRVLWDFWTALDGAVTHLFYLTAPDDLPDPEMRHARARVAHATSSDLVTWRDHGITLDVGPRGAWDDHVIWTGSVIRHGAGWAMLYTGASLAEDGKVQRIGLALSDDLETWRKHPANPVMARDKRWYMGANPVHRHEAAWRDPYVITNPDGAGFLCFITAQAAGADPAYAGCVALARSNDLVDWTIHAPVAPAGVVRFHEIPQVAPWRGRWRLVFSAAGAWVAPGVGFNAEYGAYMAEAPSPLGPYEIAGPLRAPPGPGAYGVKLVDNPHGGPPVGLAWLGYDAAGHFRGALSAPFPLDAMAPW